MSKTILTDAKTRIEYIPFHKYIGIYDDRAQNYCEFWKRHDCDEVMHRVEDLAWNYDIEKNGFSDSFLEYQDHSQFFSWSNGRPCYQRHYPEAIGYEILRPIEIKY